MESIKNLSDVAKFFIMLLLYTGYMTWWAATVSHDVRENREHIEKHIAESDHPIYQTHAIKQLTKTVESQTTILTTLTEDHVRCKLLIELLSERLRQLEDLEDLEHDRI